MDQRGLSLTANKVMQMDYKRLVTVEIGLFVSYFVPNVYSKNNTLALI